MTISDTLRMARHYALQVIAIMLVGLLAGVCVGIFRASAGTEYAAKSVLTVSEPTATVSSAELIPIVQSIAVNIISDYTTEETWLSRETVLGDRTIAFKAVSLSPEAAIDAANAAAQETAQETSAAFRAMADRYKNLTSKDGDASVEAYGDDLSELIAANSMKAIALDSVVFTVNEATEAVPRGGWGDVLKFSLIGFAFGALSAAVFLVVVDYRRSPIKGRDDFERHFNLNILADRCDDHAVELLWANIRFIVKRKFHTVCIIPAKAPVESHFLSELLEEAREGVSSGDGGFANDVELVVADPLNEGAQGAYAAHNADITVVWVTPWKDSRKDVARLLNELELAHANIAGVIIAGRSEPS